MISNKNNTTIPCSNSCTYSCSGSQRLTHGSRVPFLLKSDSPLGTVRAVTLRWEYDHELDPLNLTKMCVFGLCSDHLFIRNITLRSLQTGYGR